MTHIYRLHIRINYSVCQDTWDFTQTAFLKIKHFNPHMKRHIFPPIVKVQKQIIVSQPHIHIPLWMTWQLLSSEAKNLVPMMGNCIVQKLLPLNNITRDMGRPKTHACVGCRLSFFLSLSLLFKQLLFGLQKVAMHHDWQLGLSVDWMGMWLAENLGPHCSSMVGSDVNLNETTTKNKKPKADLKLKIKSNSHLQI